MRIIFNGFLLILSGGILSGCASQAIIPSAGTNIAVNRPNVTQPPPTIIPAKGLETVLGLTAPQLKRAFGKVQLDVSEANGRKLQFRGKACIMDVYLYAPDGQATPVATHIDARRSDGAEVDRESCVKALRRQ